jgi:CRISPR/Cas system-associated protein Cas5 (RAMP superfamily)
VTIEDFRWYMLDLKRAKPRAKAAMKAALIEAEQEAVVEREHLRNRLEKQWRIPEYALTEEQIDICLVSLRKYEEWSDALYGARRLIDREGRVEV